MGVGHAIPGPEKQGGGLSLQKVCLVGAFWLSSMTNSTHLHQKKALLTNVLSRLVGEFGIWVELTKDPISGPDPMISKPTTEEQGPLTTEAWFEEKLHARST